MNMEIPTGPSEPSDNLKVKPVFYNLKSELDKGEFKALLNSNPTIVVLDEIIGQLQELIKLNNPREKFTTEELSIKIEEHLAETPHDEYGVWVYYPWLNMVIHLLDEEEFVEVRTVRNKYKITPKEEEILKGKKVGIIGLSVGKAIAMTIATERVCGELVLADFDRIELSNLNRIPTGVQNLGVLKTVVVAREIAEIDPYLKVTCYHEGLTEDNVDDFFCKDGKLDACIEVCDGLHAKIYSRFKARSLGVPVLMNSSDRGATDIERFDLDPERSILHGLIDHLDVSLVKEAKTNEEKVPYLLPMIGIDTTSERLKASILEIESSITSWPQLASAVVLGGGICTDVLRRLFLGQFNKSGRYYVALDEEINDEILDHIAKIKQEEQITLIPKTSLDDYRDILKEANDKLLATEFGSSVDLKPDEIEDLVKHGIMAPSGGNSQPWKWLYKNQTLMLFHDLNRAVSILNYKHGASMISLGAASENLILRAHEMGYEVELNKFPLGEGNELIAAFKFFEKASPTTETHHNDELSRSISLRYTNRNISERKALKKEDLSYLDKIVSSVNGAKLLLFEEAGQIEELKKVLAEVDKLFMTNKQGHTHFIHEIRWSKKEAEITRDGIDINTLDLTPSERAGLILTRNWNVTKHIKKWNLGKEFGKLSKKAVDASGALGMITMPAFDLNHCFDGGRAVQKVWLGATHKGIAFQPMSISTFLFSKVGDNNFEDIEDIREETSVLYQRLRDICGLTDGQKDVFFFRLAIAEEPQIKSLRRTVKDVLMFE